MQQTAIWNFAPADTDRLLKLLNSFGCACQTRDPSAKNMLTLAAREFLQAAWRVEEGG